MKKPRSFTTFAIISATLTAVVLASISCARTGELSGEVFLLDSGTSPMPVAGIEVSLLAGAKELEDIWTASVANFKSEYPAAEKDYKEALAAMRKADPEWDSPSRFFHPHRPRSKGEAQGEKTHLDIAERRLRELVARYAATLSSAIEKHRVKTVLTGTRGNYEMGRISAGRYFVFAEFTRWTPHLGWLIPVEVAPGTNKIHLSNANANWPFVVPDPRDI